MADTTQMRIAVTAEQWAWLELVARERDTTVIAAAEWAIEQAREDWQGEGDQDGPGA